MTMGASSSKAVIRTEVLEPREFLSAALVDFGVMPRSAMPIACDSSVHVFAPIQIQNNAGTIDWQAFTIGSNSGEVTSTGSGRSDFLPNSAASLASAGADSDSASATTIEAFGIGTTAALQRPTNPANSVNGSDREAYLESLTAANGTEIVTTPTAPDAGATSTGFDNGNNGLGKVIKVHRGGKGAGPGILHPGQGGGRGSGSGGGSDGNSGSGASHDPSSDVLLSVVPIGPAVTQSADLQSAGDSYVSSMASPSSMSAGQANSVAQTAIAEAGRTAPSVAKMSFSVLPLAVAEMQIPANAVQLPALDSAPQETLTQQFVSGVRSVAAAVKAVDEIVISEAMHSKVKLVNLFHIDALATFGDAMGAFIEESAAPGTIHHPVASRAKAWRITVGVAAADVALVAGWLSSRRAEESKAKAKKASILSRLHLFSFHTSLSPR
jgi:hypothetical protein